ncbi:MAG: hypothetical protein R3B09_06795 [Nannocystaceae bacterium]
MPEPRHQPERRRQPALLFERDLDQLRRATAAAAARARAIASAASAKSTAVTSQPARARHTACTPAPQPRSRARPGAPIAATVRSNHAPGASRCQGSASARPTAR